MHVDFPDTDAMAQLHEFTAEQIKQYYTYIKFPSRYQLAVQDIQNRNKEFQIDFVNCLLRHQLVSVPWENLDLHYASVKGISLDAEFLFRKVVTRSSGRGGYCMQNNLFFATILRSLGFLVTSHGARVAKTFGSSSQKSPTEEIEYGGWGHQVNIVTFSDQSKYFCDVGFGSAGPTCLVPLRDGFSGINTGTPDNVASTMTLSRGWSANNIVRDGHTKLWIYSVKYGTLEDNSKDWNICYCFADVEFEPDDFVRMSWHVSTSRTSMFVNMVLAQVFIMSDDAEHIIGDITLVDKTIKERRFGQSRELAIIKSEADRISALEQFFNIRLYHDEIVAINGFPTMIVTKS